MNKANSLVLQGLLKIDYLFEWIKQKPARNDRLFYWHKHRWLERTPTMASARERAVARVCS
jgi:hypothetical protein